MMEAMLRSGSVLIALHYQNEVLHADGKIGLGVAKDNAARSDIVAAAARLLASAREAGWPVLHVRIAFPPGHRGVLTNAPIFRNVVAAGACEEGSWGASFHEGLGPVEGEPVVSHNRVNAFFDSPLEMHLRRLGARRLVMAGIATNSVVEHSARHAADMGYEVLVAHDACSAAKRSVHEAALHNISLIGELTTTSNLFPPA